MRVKDAVGRFGEQAAAEHLAGCGMQILDRNWRGRRGELDIVARDGGTVVFVEVKTRSSDRFGSPAEAVTYAKMTRIRALAAQWLAENRAAGVPVGEVRFDVIAVLRRPSGTGPGLSHLRSAF